MLYHMIRKKSLAILASLPILPAFMGSIPHAMAEEAALTPEHVAEIENGDGLYAEAEEYQYMSSLGETPGPGPTFGSRVFVYVNGDGLQANYAEVGWRGSYEYIQNVCGGSAEIQWTDAQGNHQSKNAEINNCTTPPQVNYPGHYVTFDMSQESFSPNTQVCGRCHMDFGTSPWACVEMKP